MRLRDITTATGFARGRGTSGLILMLLVALLWLSPTTGHSQAKVGTTGSQFLELGVSARAMGMAEAFTAVANDVTAVYYNPAGLTSLWGKEAAFTYVAMPADVGHGFAAIGTPLESVGGVVGVGVYALSSGSMDVTDYSYPLGNGQTFGWNNFALGVSYGRYLTDRFSIGVTLRYIGEFTHDYNANGWSADVGTSYDTGHRGFKIAMVITNFGPDLTMVEKAYPLPINFKFGGAINLIDGEDHILTFAAEGSHPSDNLEKYNAGLEYSFRDRYFLRGGHRFNYDEDGFTAGAGMRLPMNDDRSISVDYAFQDFGILTEVHRFTLAMSF